MSAEKAGFCLESALTDFGDEKLVKTTPGFGIRRRRKTRTVPRCRISGTRALRYEEKFPGNVLQRVDHFHRLIRKNTELQKFRRQLHRLFVRVALFGADEHQEPPSDGTDGLTVHHDVGAGDALQ